MDFLSTVKGSALEGFYPAGWDFAKIDACIGAPETVCDRQDFWNPAFTPVMCESLGEFETYMGHEIAMQIKLAKDRGEKIAFILPVGPMGMYKWVVYFLKEWKVSCKHVYTFNMDEWADAEGNTLAPDNSGAFQYAMEQALFNPLGELTVPKEQRNFATKENLPTYPEKIKGNVHAQAFYGVITAILDDVMDISANIDVISDISIRITEIVDEHNMVDWQTNKDIHNKIAQDIDDMFYEIEKEKGIQVDFDSIDKIIENVITVALRRFK